MGLQKHMTLRRTQLLKQPNNIKIKHELSQSNEQFHRKFF